MTTFTGDLRYAIRNIRRRRDNRARRDVIRRPRDVHAVELERGARLRGSGAGDVQ